MTEDPGVYEHVRVCRDCGEEYRPEVARCADCGGELEDRRAGDGLGASRETAEGPSIAAEAEAERAAAQAELASSHVLYRGSQVRDLVPLAERLRETGMDCRIAEQAGAKGGPASYCLLVRQDDVRAALAAVADLIAPHEAGADVHAVETRFDQERGYVECPACGAAPPAGALECPECGLGLGGEEAAEEPGK